MRNGAVYSRSSAISSAPTTQLHLGVGANGGVFATLNGETAQFDPFSTLGRVSITSIEVDDRTGNDTINVLQTKANVPVGIETATPP